ncbi:hypothetical protein RSSM_06020 [Rhodopirellula sallentina SM41]|uniref:Uncharacterized protein n=1 Tax=Rhodopirellula sallentina SM41 TaxID=1263870 RepID=M5U3V6_9BACT|nr:hypothetical protein RSSM_06020 [Rhodopirellula sallentina SM41]
MVNTSAIPRQIMTSTLYAKRQTRQENDPIHHGKQPSSTERFGPPVCGNSTTDLL